MSRPHAVAAVAPPYVAPLGDQLDLELEKIRVLVTLIAYDQPLPDGSRASDKTILADVVLDLLELKIKPLVAAVHAAASSSKTGS